MSVLTQLCLPPRALMSPFVASSVWSQKVLGPTVNNNKKIKKRHIHQFTAVMHNWWCWQMLQQAQYLRKYYFPKNVVKGKDTLDRKWATKSTHWKIFIWNALCNKQQCARLLVYCLRSFSIWRVYIPKDDTTALSLIQLHSDVSLLIFNVYCSKSTSSLCLHMKRHPWLSCFWNCRFPIKCIS